ncbi:MAG TPA: DUF5696 domain-containing protein [Candidatus Avimonas sp.]|nr:DUF5696 domain-containing protein [Candidatus Avimonas sp.]HQD38316.1 DUF5696 domain-containing protein [Candidatus Avimonas sp.]
MRKTWFAGFMALALCSVVMTGVFAQPDNSAAGGDVALPVSDGYQKIAENSRFILSADTKNGYISLTDKEGVIWYSLPEGYQQDELAQNITKRAMESVLQISYADKLRNIKNLNAKTTSVDRGGLKCSKIKNGIRMVFQFDKEDFTIPVDFTLGEQHLEVSVAVSEITEANNDYQLTTISVLPYFGAADRNANGYVFLPDGCGALIELNRPDQYIEDYSQYVYGREPSTAKINAENLTQRVSMPVFGIKNGNNAMMGIITSGAGRAIINASVNGKRCSYSNVYPQFIYRDSEMVTIEQKGQTIRVIEKNPPKSNDYKVRYYFLNGDKADYVGMAHKFGEWLMADYKPDKTQGSPFYLELTGGVMVKDNILGFPVERVAPLTTYSDVADIADSLSKMGVGDLVIYLKYWQKDGTEAAIPVSVAPEPRLGGEKGFKSMLKALADMDAQVYLDFNLTEIVKSRMGYGKRSASVMSIQNSPAVQYSYYINTLRAKFTEPSFLLRLDKALKAAQKITASAKSYDFTGAAASSLGSTLYSDFSGKTVKRDVSDRENAKILKVMRDIKGRQLLSNPNDHGLPFADVAVDTPIFSSSFLTHTCEVPFYQIAVHEYIPMSTPDINTLSDPDIGVLKALEAGIGLKYVFTMRTNRRVSQSSFNTLNGPLFDEGAPDAVESWKEVKELLIKVAGKRIISHRIINKSVRETVFEGGIRVFVNYGAIDYSSDGLNVKAKNFTVLQS